MSREDQIKYAEQIIACGCSDELRAILKKDFPELTLDKDKRIKEVLSRNLEGNAQFRWEIQRIGLHPDDVLFLIKSRSIEWQDDYREEDLQTRFAFYMYKDEPNVLFLSNLFVEEASRNKGLGTKILIAAEKVAEVIGASCIRLKVKQNTSVNAWYRKHGYGYMTFEDGYDWLEKNLEYLKSRQEQPEVDLEKEIDACWQNWLSPSNQKEVEGVLPKIEFATYARHFYELGQNSKPAEWSEEENNRLTVKGNGVYKVCSRCGERMERDDSKIYTSDPPQYGYTCPKCGEVEFDTIRYDSPAKAVINPNFDPQLESACVPSQALTKEWSKNDEIFFKEIIDFFENNTVRLQHDLSMYAHWLKSLHNRLVAIPKQEWSEEDERRFISCMGRLQTVDGSPTINSDWFEEHCYKHPSWKPSEEQMKALTIAKEYIESTYAFREYRLGIESLYQDLKKL